MANVPADFKGLSFLPTFFFFFVRVKHCDLKAFTLINPSVTSAGFTDFVVGNWHRGAQLLTDITEQPSQT